MINLRVKLAVKIINTAIKLLPEEYRCYVFVSNCMKVGIIKVKK